jgi:hypothetical protein
MKAVVYQYKCAYWDFILFDAGSSPNTRLCNCHMNILLKVPYPNLMLPMFTIHIQMHKSWCEFILLVLNSLNLCGHSNTSPVVKSFREALCNKDVQRHAGIPLHTPGLDTTRWYDLATSLFGKKPLLNVGLSPWWAPSVNFKLFKPKFI